MHNWRIFLRKMISFNSHNQLAALTENIGAIFFSKISFDVSKKFDMSVMEQIKCASGVNYGGAHVYAFVCVFLNLGEERTQSEKKR
tara:strand:- start:1033 stop:1290 length:258 start_codon:yes stop_codon:yes gene_type:complete